MDTLGSFAAVFDKGVNFHDLQFASLYTDPPSEKGSTLKKGANYLLLENSPFQKVGKTNFDRYVSLESVSVPPPPQEKDNNAFR